MQRRYHHFLTRSRLGVGRARWGVSDWDHQSTAAPPQGCWGAFGDATRRFGDACESGLTFHKALLHLCGHLRGIRGGGSNSHTSQQRLRVSTRAARGAHRVGSWGLALGSGAADQELAIDHSSPGLATRLQWREGDSSQACVPVLSLAKPCDVGFLPFSRVRGGRHWVAGEKQLVP